MPVSTVMKIPEAYEAITKTQKRHRRRMILYNKMMSQTFNDTGQSIDARRHIQPVQTSSTGTNGFCYMNNGAILPYANQWARYGRPAQYTPQLGAAYQSHYGTWHYIPVPVYSSYEDGRYYAQCQ